MRKPISILLAAVLLSSCAWQDKGGAAPDAGDDKVLSIEQADTGKVSALYEGYEELQGKQIGEHIVMPEVITPQDISEVYTFDTEDNYDKENRVERGTEFYKRFFGDDFNADRLYYFEYEGEEEYNALSYNPHNPYVPEGVYDPDSEAYGEFRGFPASAGRSDTWFGTMGEEIIAEYDPVKDKDAVMELDGGSFTVGEICETVQSFFDTEFAECEGVAPRPFKVKYFTCTDDDKICKRAYVDCGYVMENTPIENYFGSYNFYKETAKGTEETYYSPIYYHFILTEKDSIYIYNSSRLGPQKATSINKVENVISLKTAAELLDKNLAEKMLFKIENISLIYCRKVTSYDYIDERELPDSQKTQPIIGEFRPTWVFEFMGGLGSLNVDAITGEITIDATVTILNEMRRGQ